MVEAHGEELSLNVAWLLRDGGYCTACGVLCDEDIHQCGRAGQHGDAAALILVGMYEQVCDRALISEKCHQVSE